MATVVQQPADGGGQLEVLRVPCLSDNYAWVLHEPGSGATAVRGAWGGGARLVASRTPR